MKRAVSILVVSLLVACGSSPKKANTSSDSHSDSSSSSTSSDTSTAPSATATPSATAATATTSSAPPANACPFTCFIADGANKIPVSPEDQEKLRGSLESTMSGIRGCVGNGRRHRLTTPAINVRVNSAGEVTDVGVDVHGYDGETSCLENVSHPSPDGTFSGPADIRCFEKCEPPPRAAKSAKKK